MKYVCEQCNKIFDSSVEANTHEKNCRLMNTIRTEFAKKFEGRNDLALNLQDIRMWPDERIRELIDVIEAVYKPLQLHDLFDSLWPDFSHLKK